MKKLGRKNAIIKCIPLIAGLLLLAFIFMLTTKRGLKYAKTVTEETLDFAQDTCERYENYENGNKVKDLISLQQKATVIARYESYGERLTDAVLKEYQDDTELTGAFVLDENFNTLAQTDDSWKKLFSEIVKKNYIKDILNQPAKVYMERIKKNNRTYDFAVVSRDKQKGLVVCYNDITDKKVTENEIRLQNLLSGYRFKMDGIVLITDGTDVLNSNNEQEQGKSILNTSLKSIRGGQLCAIKYKGRRWYGSLRIYKNYSIYALVPGKMVFMNRRSIMAYGVAIYIVCVLIMLFLYMHTTRTNMRKLQEQLQTIAAIGRIYTANFLIHIDTGSWEKITLPPALEDKMKRDWTAWEMLQFFAEKFIAESYRNGYRQFANLHTMEERLSENTVITYESESTDGKWLSSQIIPQKKTEDGHIRSVFLLIRDLTEERQKELKYQQELCEAAKREKNANIAKTEYLCYLNQEMRNQVEGIRGMIEISRQNADDPGKQEQCRGQVMKITGQMLDGLEDMPGMPGKIEPLACRKIFHMHHLYREIAVMIESLAQEVNVPIEIQKFSGEHTQVIGNADYIRHIMQYIAGNAMKYNMKGKTLNISCREVSAEKGIVTYAFCCGAAETYLQEDKKTEVRLLFTLDLAEDNRYLFTTGGTESAGTTFRIA